MKVLEAVPLDILEGLRRAIDADDVRALGELLTKQPIDVTSVPFTETELVYTDDDGNEQKDGNIWDALGGRYAWCLRTLGEGGDEAKCVTPLEYAKRRSAPKAHKLLEILEQTTRNNAKPPRVFD